MIKITKLGPLQLIVKTKSAILVGRGVFHTTGVSDIFTKARFSFQSDFSLRRNGTMLPFGTVYALKRQSSKSPTACLTKKLGPFFCCPCG